MNFELWMLFIIFSIIAAMIEIFVPTFFCINFAFAGIVTAIISIFWGNLTILTIIFIALSILSLLVLKPILFKFVKKENCSDFDTTYIGKIVKTLSPVTNLSGAISIYDERWEARTKTEGEEIPEGTDVKIIGNENTVLFVEKI